jgi:hypothetical protein
MQAARGRPVCVSGHPASPCLSSTRARRPSKGSQVPVPCTNRPEPPRGPHTNRKSCALPLSSPSCRLKVHTMQGRRFQHLGKRCSRVFFSSSCSCLLRIMAPVAPRRVAPSLPAYTQRLAYTWLPCRHVQVPRFDTWKLGTDTATRAVERTPRHAPSSVLVSCRQHRSRPMLPPLWGGRNINFHAAESSARR